MGTFDIPDTESFLFPEANKPSLKIESWSNSARTVEIRGFTKHGQISHDHTTNSDRSVAETTFRIPDYPIVLSLAPSAGPVRRGELYVRITLQNSGADVGRLSAGYLTDDSGITWPPGKFEGMTEGKGLIRVITGTNPAANTEITESVPTNARWKVKSLYIVLVVDATAANRGTRLLFDDGSNVIAEIPDTIAITASQTKTFTYGVGLENFQAIVNTANHSIALHDIILFQGYRFRTATAGMQAGDNYAAPIFEVEEWIEE